LQIFHSVIAIYQTTQTLSFKGDAHMSVNGY